MVNKDNLRPEIIEFATPAFSMRSELDELSRVYQVGAVHSTVLICGRILHTLVAEALGKLASPAVFTNLSSLYRLNLVGSPTQYWLNAIRRTANDARHVHRQLESRDALWILLYTEKCLEWFFCKLPRANAQEAITISGEPLRLTEAETERRLIAAFDAPDFNPVTFVDELLAITFQEYDITLLSAVIEELINRGNLEAANHLLGLAKAHDRFDLKIAQLQGLYWRRLGNLDQALDVMKPVFSKYSSDEEAAGIMAAIWKELWLASQANYELLRKAYKIYSDNWKRSGKFNTYLGINAATTALWLNKRGEAKRTATIVQQQILSSITTLHKIYPTRLPSFDSVGMWEQLSLAEAELILENIEQAQQIYSSIFKQFAAHQSAIQVAKKQASKICESLKLPTEQPFN